MLVFSGIAWETMMLGLNPFSLIFNLSIVYLPSSILLGLIIFNLVKRWVRRTARATGAALNVESRVA